MRKSLAAFGAWTFLGAAACAPVARDVPLPISAPSDFATDHSSSAPQGVPRILLDAPFMRAWPDESQGIARSAIGGFLVSTRIPGDFVAIRAPLVDVPRDVIVSATFRKVGGPPGGGYGLILRDQGTSSGDGVDQTGQFVVAEVGDRGETGVWQRDDDRWTDLVPWTPSSAIHTDAGGNDLTVHLLGDRLTFIANGTQIADLDVGLRTGAVGIFVGGDRNEVQVARFRVQAPGRTVDLTAASNQPAPSNAVPADALAEQPHPRPQPPAAPRPPATLSHDDSPIAEAQRLRDLLVSFSEDIRSLLSTFSDGFDGPHSPVNDPIALKQAAARLDQATDKALEVQAELDRIHNGATDRGR